MSKILNRNYIEGECDANGKWLKNKELPGQTYVKCIDVGRYSVIHNNPDVGGIGIGLYGAPGLVSIHNVTSASFDLDIKVDGTYTNMPFRIYLSGTSNA